MHPKIIYLVIFATFLGPGVQGYPTNATSSDAVSAPPSSYEPTRIISSVGLASFPKSLPTTVNEPRAILVVPTQVEKKKDDDDSEETPDPRPTVAPDGRGIIYLKTW